MNILWVEVNKSFRNYISERKLARLIKAAKFLPEYKERMLILFTEVSPTLIYKFAMEHKIPLKDLKIYYEKFIKPLCKNEKLEDIFLL